MKYLKDIAFEPNIFARCPIKNVLALRLISLVASKVRKEDKLGQRYEIPVEELLGSNYSASEFFELKEVITELMRSVVEVESGSMWSKFNIFSTCIIEKEENILRIQFDEALLPFYLFLRKNFEQ